MGETFLEYAPIKRRYDTPYEKQSEPSQPDALSALDANLAMFPAGTAQVLEYWLDVSRFSGWKRPAVRLPWRRDVLEADLATYASRGIRHVTSFAVYVDAEYRKRYGEPQTAEQQQQSFPPDSYLSPLHTTSLASPLPVAPSVAAGPRWRSRRWRPSSPSGAPARPARPERPR